MRTFRSPTDGTLSSKPCRIHPPLKSQANPGFFFFFMSIKHLLCARKLTNTLIPNLYDTFETGVRMKFLVLRKVKYFAH